MAHQALRLVAAWAPFGLLLMIMTSLGSVAAVKANWDYKHFSAEPDSPDSEGWGSLEGTWCGSTEQSPIDILRASELESYLPLPEGFGPIIILPTLPAGEVVAVHRGYDVAFTFPPVPGVVFSVPEGKPFTSMYGTYSGTGVLGGEGNNGTPENVAAQGSGPEAADGPQFNLTADDPNVFIDQAATLVNLSWHVPSEHTINGRVFAAEANFIHFVSRPGDPDCTYVSASGDGPYCVAVVSVLYDAHVNNSERLDSSGMHVDSVIRALAPLPRSSNSDNSSASTTVAVDFEVDLEAFLPPEDQRELWTYRGSLTTPACNENVTWAIMQQAVPMGWDTYVELRDAILEDADIGDRNARPPLPLNSRAVYVSNIDTGGLDERVIEGTSNFTESSGALHQASSVAALGVVLSCIMTLFS